MKILALINIYLWLGLRIFAPRALEPHYYQIDCKIYDETSALLLMFPAFTCAFADDGEWLGLEENTLKLFDSRNQVKFIFPYNVHHELRFSLDQKKIYFLSTDLRKYKGVVTRFDVLNVADRNGKLLYSWNTADHIDELVSRLNLSYLLNALPFSLKDIPRRDADYEFSHLNAIAEIPPNPLEYILPYMKRGNLLVTFNGLGKIVIFDPKLSKIIHVFGDFVRLNAYGFHDAQILPNGHLIFFNNINDPDHEVYTSIDEYDVLMRKRTWTFKFERPEFDLNKINGTVQVLPNNNVVIGENSFGGRVVEITRQGKIVYALSNQRKDESTNLPTMLYRAKKISADKFIQNNIAGAMIK